MRAELSPGALADLEDIEEYIARDDPEAAERWIRKILAKVERAGESPRAGRISSTTRASARCC
ncbi:type II toxin-antitoxin system RelE/ParE family toxin [Sorangium sp. So ce1151]|uniref:type II toxin-antitoxin system RelE/ParE family toxin n=1 Tax=Sorangium sp. So ce1151 TaxID=3133332 RepID=UPI003F6371A9